MVVLIVVHLGGCWVVGADKSLSAAVRGARFTTFDQVRSDGRLDILVGIEGRSPAFFRPTSWADRRELLREVDGNHNKTAIFDLRLCAIALPCVGAATWMGHRGRDFYTDLAQNRRAIVCFCCAYQLYMAMASVYYVALMFASLIANKNTFPLIYVEKIYDLMCRKKYYFYS